MRTACAALYDSIANVSSARSQSGKQANESVPACTQANAPHVVFIGSRAMQLKSLHTTMPMMRHSLGLKITATEYINRHMDWAKFRPQTERNTHAQSIAFVSCVEIVLGAARAQS